MGKAYPGDCEGKRQTREAQYREAQRTLSKTAREGWALILAGDECSDLPWLRRLGWREDRILIIDRDPVMIRRARKLAPKARFFCGDILDALIEMMEREDRIGICILDLMGSFKAETDEYVGMVAALALAGAFFSFTFQRARETNQNPFWAKGLSRFGLDRITDLPSVKDRHSLRENVYQGLVEAAFRDTDRVPPKLLNRHRYQNRVPMGVLSFKVAGSSWLDRAK